MIEAEAALAKLREISKTSAFNEWLGLEVTAAAEGSAELQLVWRSEFGQYSGFLHAGLIGRL
jgi:acyl-coenzyme A thioesterase PaaI-like protein